MPPSQIFHLGGGFVAVEIVGAAWLLSSVLTMCLELIGEEGLKAFFFRPIHLGKVYSFS